MDEEIKQLEIVAKEFESNIDTRRKERLRYSYCFLVIAIFLISWLVVKNTFLDSILLSIIGAGLALYIISLFCSYLGQTLVELEHLEGIKRQIALLKKYNDN